MTPGAVGLTLLQSTNSLTEIPDDFAMEVAPYWLAPHLDKTWRDDIERTVGESLARTLSFSVATSQAGEDTTSLAVGIRASLLSGKSSPRFIERMENLEQYLGDISNAISEYMQEHGEMPTDDDIADMKRELDEGRSQAEEQLQDIEYERIGWFWEVAAAGSVAFPGNTVSRHQNEGWATWTTVSREWEGVSLLGVARFQNNERIADGTVGDFGGRFVVKAPRFSASLELVMRSMEKRRPQSRTVAVLEYAVRNDAWLSFSVGEDYDNAQPNSLIARLGININFDRSRRIE